jgi:hypothetical protein
LNARLPVVGLLAVAGKKRNESAKKMVERKNWLKGLASYSPKSNSGEVGVQNEKKGIFMKKPVRNASLKKYHIL